MTDSESSESTETSDNDSQLNCWPSLTTAFTNVSMEPEHDNMPCIHMLSDDSLLHIFAYLDYVEAAMAGFTCKRWFNLVLDYFSRIKSFCFHNTFSIFRLNHSLSVKDFIVILTRSQGNVADMDFSQNPFRFTKQHCTAIQRFCPRLKSLNLSGLTIKSKVVSALPELLPKSITELNLSSCRFVTEKRLLLLLKSLPNISKINLSYCIKLNGKTIKSNVRANSLAQCSLEGCTNLNEDVITFLLDSQRDSLISFDISFIPKFEDFAFALELKFPMPKLKKFRFEKGMYDEQNPVPLVPVLNPKALLTKTPNLTSLDLSYQPLLQSPDAIKTISVFCGDLEYLNINGTHINTKADMEALKNLKGLKKLVINRFTVNTVNMVDDCIKVLSEIVSLNILSIQYLSFLTDGHVEELLNSLVNLDKLDIRSSRNDDLVGRFFIRLPETRSKGLLISCEDTFIDEFFYRERPYLTAYIHPKINPSVDYREIYHNYDDGGLFGAAQYDDLDYERWQDEDSYPEDYEFTAIEEADDIDGFFNEALQLDDEQADRHDHMLYLQQQEDEEQAERHDHMLYLEQQEDEEQAERRDHMLYLQQLEDEEQAERHDHMLYLQQQEDEEQADRHDHMLYLQYQERELYGDYHDSNDEYEFYDDVEREDYEFRYD